MKELAATHCPPPKATQQREVSQKRLEGALERVLRMKKSAYEDYQDKLITREDFQRYQQDLFNTLLFTFGAFLGVYSFDILINICIASYVIFFVTSVCDTPMVYLARAIKNKKHL